MEGADFRRADFNGAFLTRAVIGGADFSFAGIVAAFADDMNLADYDGKKVKFTHADFYGTNDYCDGEKPTHPEFGYVCVKAATGNWF
ncbi:pentapeptide repeat-containing protein [Streptantibioticus rubrisoli]|uniref:Pentapeptide repeat-containing protein n=1 Tax=Streptantibioticus rubrisoli TaxID=1387313 RepID=A0ABT1PJB5_9ACTN|nr:pentapeptide repeat-containing protein [Streptantibioticus rubrisoli]MCQ4045461.1 pentapeptide repeat-containing protein [Streptantibioticus rubrisoli]